LITNTKKAIYGALLAGSVALLVPTLLEARRELPVAAVVDLPAEGVADPSAAGPAAAATQAGVEPYGVQEHDDGVEPESSPHVEPPAERARASTSRARHAVRGDAFEALNALERALGRMENFGATRAPRLDHRIASSRDGFSWSDGSSPPNARAGEIEQTESTQQAHAREELERFLDDAPLCGVLIAESGRAALFGGRVVRPGDELVAGVTVAAIEARGVRIACGDFEQWALLPPIAARPGSSSASPVQQVAAPAHVEAPAPESAPVDDALKARQSRVEDQQP
jgi:hypothetical protein